MHKIYTMYFGGGELHHVQKKKKKKMWLTVWRNYNWQDVYAYDLLRKQIVAYILSVFPWPNNK